DFLGPGAVGDVPSPKVGVEDDETEVVAVVPLPGPLGGDEHVAGGVPAVGGATVRVTGDEDPVLRPRAGLVLQAVPCGEDSVAVLRVDHRGSAGVVHAVQGEVHPSGGGGDQASPGPAADRGGGRACRGGVGVWAAAGAAAGRGGGRVVGGGGTGEGGGHAVGRPVGRDGALLLGGGRPGLVHHLWGRVQGDRVGGFNSRGGGYPGCDKRE